MGNKIPKDQTNTNYLKIYSHLNGIIKQQKTNNYILVIDMMVYIITDLITKQK